MMSGPGTNSGVVCAGSFREGRTDDWAAPLTKVVISIGYIVAAMEIFPTIEPASAGRPNLFASSSEIRSLPPSMLSERVAAS